MPQPHRPFVVMTMATSLDGKIAPARGPQGRLGSAADLRRMLALRTRADAVVVGAGTLRAIDPPMGLADSRLRAARLRGGRCAEPMVVVLSRRGQVSASARAFALRPDRPRPLLVTACALQQLPRTLRSAVRRKALQHLACPRAGTIDVLRLLAGLGRAGVDSVLVEGGGETAWPFVAAGVVDEIHLSLAPCLLGGRTAPTMVAGAGASLAAAPRFVLHAVHRAGNELALVYRSLAARRPPT